ncbi:nuclear transport factor 2 family protein [Thermaurantiacus sp.]
MPGQEEAIRRVLALYCHALDRRAFHLLVACFHTDATYHFAAIKGDWRHFVEAAKAVLLPLSGTHHQLGQSLIAHDGPNCAHVETWFTAVHLVPADAPADAPFPGTGQAYEAIVWGRYIDRFEQRDGCWRIAHRIGLHDGRHDRPSADAGFAALPAHWRGAHGAADPAHLVGERAAG